MMNQHTDAMQTGVKSTIGSSSATLSGEDPASVFAQNGFWVHRRPSENFLKLVKKGADLFAQMMRDENQLKNVTQAFKNKDGKFRHLCFVHENAETFHALIRSQEISEIVKSVLGEGAFYVTHSKISFKTKGEELPWLPHQDNGYKLASGTPVRKGMTVAIFLEAASEANGTMQMYPRTHLLKTLPHHFVKENEDGAGQIVIDQIPAGYDPVVVNAEQGNVMAFSLDTIHQSGSNHAGGYRPIFIFEIEPFTGIESDEWGNPPVLVNGTNGPLGNLRCRMHGLPKKIRRSAVHSPVIRRIYRMIRPKRETA